MIGYWFRRLADVIEQHAEHYCGPTNEMLFALADILREVAAEDR